MTTITFNEKINFSKNNYENLYDFLEEVEDMLFGKIILNDTDNKSLDISLLEQKYLGK